MSGILDVIFFAIFVVFMAVLCSLVIGDILNR